jgi:hypothetical protein
MMRNDRYDTSDDAMGDDDLHLTEELANANLKAEGDQSHRKRVSVPRRVPTFEQYVKTLPLAEQEKIRRAEREYLEGRGSRVRQAETVFAEQMQGLKDSPDPSGRS